MTEVHDTVLIGSHTEAGDCLSRGTLCRWAGQVPHGNAPDPSECPSSDALTGHGVTVMVPSRMTTQYASSGVPLLARAGPHCLDGLQS
jgi:hypothetical protein